MALISIKNIFKDRFVIFAMLVNSDSIKEMLFKLYALKKLLSEKSFQDRKFTAEELFISLEDFPNKLPKKRVLELTESIGILKKEDDRYFLKDSILIEELDKGKRLPKKLKGEKISIKEIKQILFKKEAEDRPFAINAIKNAIYKGLRWMHFSIKEALNPESGLKGLPPFWKCEDGKDSPFGYLQAGTSNADTLGTLSDSFFNICTYEKCGFEKKEKKEILETGLKFVLDCQVTKQASFGLSKEQIPWNKGGFMAHDDQPDAYYPTVDATWDALIALSSFYVNYQTFTELYGSLCITKEELGKRIISGIEFMLRMQLQNGGWGIYRYSGDSATVYPYEYTHGTSILALCLCKLCSVIEDTNRELLEKTDTALKKGFKFIKDKKQKYQSYNVWTPFFTSEPDGCKISDILKTSAWICTGLLAMYRQFESLRKEIAPMLQDFVSLADKYWQLNYKAYASVEFKVPLKERINDTFNQWTNRLDVTVAILLVDIYNETCGSKELNIVITEKLWNNIEGTISNALQEQHPEHGHWNEPVQGNPLAAATMMVLQLLNYYLKAVPSLCKLNKNKALKVNET